MALKWLSKRQGVGSRFFVVHLGLSKRHVSPSGPAFKESVCIFLGPGDNQLLFVGRFKLEKGR